jgi:hypothetical protein
MSVRGGGGEASVRRDIHLHHDTHSRQCQAAGVVPYNTKGIGDGECVDTKPDVELVCRSMLKVTLNHVREVRK